MPDPRSFPVPRNDFSTIAAQLSSLSSICPHCPSSSRTRNSRYVECHLHRTPSTSSADSKLDADPTIDKSSGSSEKQGKHSCPLKDGVDPLTNDGAGIGEVACEGPSDASSLEEAASSTDTKMAVLQRLEGLSLLSKASWTSPLASPSYSEPTLGVDKLVADLDSLKLMAAASHASSSASSLYSSARIAGYSEAETSAAGVLGFVSPALPQEVRGNLPTEFMAAAVAEQGTVLHDEYDAMDLDEQDEERAAFQRARPVHVFGDLEYQTFPPGSDPGPGGVALFPGQYIPTDNRGHIDDLSMSTEEEKEEPCPVDRTWRVIGFSINISGAGIQPCQDMMYNEGEEDMLYPEVEEDMIYDEVEEESVLLE